MRIRLSKKGWNNVLIISMLIMIFVFNSDLFNRTSSDEANVPVPIFGQNQVLLVADFGQFKIERIGNSWRQVGGAEISDISLLAQTWTQLIGTPIESLEDLHSDPYIVVLTFAGESNKRVTETFIEASGGYMRHKGVLFDISPINPQQLLPMLETK